MASWMKKYWFPLFVLAVLALSFHLMMTKDAERMCRNDAVAYTSCWGNF